MLESQKVMLRYELCSSLIPHSAILLTIFHAQPVLGWVHRERPLVWSQGAVGAETRFNATTCLYVLCLQSR